MKAVRKPTLQQTSSHCLTSKKVDICVTVPLSSWRKPCQWAVSLIQPDVAARSSSARAGLLPPVDRPAHTFRRLKACLFDLTREQHEPHHLMCWICSSDSCTLTTDKHIVQTYIQEVTVYLQVLAALHQVLDVIDGRKEQVEDLEEVVLLLREPRVCQELYQVAKVIAANIKHDRRIQISVSAGSTMGKDRTPTCSSVV